MSKCHLIDHILDFLFRGAFEILMFIKNYIFSTKIKLNMRMMKYPNEIDP